MIILACVSINYKMDAKHRYISNQLFMFRLFLMNDATFVFGSVKTNMLTYNLI